VSGDQTNLAGVRAPSHHPSVSFQEQLCWL
jgi:hypothetical protein